MEYETLWKDEWLEIRKADGWYTYSHCRHGDGVGVAVLVFNPETKMVLGRYEKTPCHHDKPKLCSLTGGVEKGDVLETALHELVEEAGIHADADSLVYLGQVWPSKASDTVMHMFALPWTGPVVEHPEGDGSEGEKGAFVEWIPLHQAMVAQDPLLPCMIARLTAPRMEEKS